MKRHVTEGADSRLGFYVKQPEPEQPLPPGFELPPQPKLPPGYVDAPLVRVFNFLRASSSPSVPADSANVNSMAF
jgi:mediator of RNA polymerase II transcription subunit 14